MAFVWPANLKGTSKGKGGIRLELDSTKRYNKLANNLCTVPKPRDPSSAKIHVCVYVYSLQFCMKNRHADYFSKLLACILKLQMALMLISKDEEPGKQFSSHCQQLLKVYKKLNLCTVLYDFLLLY